MTLVQEGRDGYSATEVCELTGATYRQVDYWIRRGHLGDPATPGSGHPRAFSLDGVVLVAALLAVSEAVNGEVAGTVAPVVRDAVLAHRRAAVVEHGPVKLTVDLAACRAQIVERARTLAA